MDNATPTSFGGTNAIPGRINRKMVLESGDIRSRNYIPGSQGWRLTPDGAELAGSTIAYTPWTTYTPTVSAHFSGTPTLGVNMYMRMCGMAYIFIDLTGTSNSADTWYIEGIPWPLKASMTNHRQALMVVDGGTNKYGQGYIIGANSRTRIYFFPSASGAGAAWTASGTKACEIQIFAYPID